MASIALFHSALGVRPGVLAAADLLRSHGHEVAVIDQYDGRVFDEYEEAGAFAAAIGYPTLMESAAAAVNNLAAPVVVAGFSNGGGMSEYAAAPGRGYLFTDQSMVAEYQPDAAELLWGRVLSFLDSVAQSPW